MQHSQATSHKQHKHRSRLKNKINLLHKLNVNTPQKFLKHYSSDTKANQFSKPIPLRSEPKMTLANQARSITNGLEFIAVVEGIQGIKFE